MGDMQILISLKFLYRYVKLSYKFSQLLENAAFFDLLRRGHPKMRAVISLSTVSAIMIDE